MQENLHLHHLRNKDVFIQSINIGLLSKVMNIQNICLTIIFNIKVRLRRIFKKDASSHRKLSRLDNKCYSQQKHLRSNDLNALKL